MSIHYFRVFADYFTFEILDEGMSGPRDLWNEKTLLDRVSTSKGAIAISTVRNMYVPVLIAIMKSGDFDDTISLDSWDHVVECSIEVLSDNLVVFGATDYYPDAPRIKIQPATYRAKIYYGGLSTLSENGLTGNDAYCIVLYPGSPISPRVIKQWEESGSR
jgi:hypothetical protein